MWVRYGYFIGTVKPENRAEFDAFCDSKAREQLLKYPGIRQVRILRARWHEEGVPGIYQTFELTFDSKEAIDVMLQSPERTAMGQLMGQIMHLFEGHTKHINYEVTAA